MDSAYDNALKKKKKLERELEEIEQFLTLYERFSGTKLEENDLGAEEQSIEIETHIVPRQRIEGSGRQRLRPRDLGPIVKRVLLETGRPMTRGPLVEALEKRGIEVKGAEKAKYLGTVLWRMGDEFVNIEGEGYWPRGMDCPAVGYKAEQDPQGVGAIEPSAEDQKAAQAELERDMEQRGIFDE
ncbi:MAG: hypothetical protein MI824_05135 [Hyphomicrobiales bacterium]|nr:hypothetical protein [Hyphomicrobiales bacterium]